MGVRGRVIACVVLLLASVQLAWGLWEVRETSDLLRWEAERRGREVMRTLAVSTSVSLAGREIESLDAILDSLSVDREHDLELEWVAIMDPAGRLVAHTDPVLFGQVPDDPFSQRALASKTGISVETGRGTDSHLLLSMPVVSGLRWGTITASVSLQSVYERIRKTRLRLLLQSAAVALLLGGILSVLLGRLVLEPLREMTKAVGRLSQRQLGVRIPHRDGYDELAVLGRVFNSMAQEIQGHTSDLEETVATRTQELQTTNAQLAEAVEQLEELARTDGLTGLANHRSLQEGLAAEVRRSDRTKRPLSFILLDVDHFKNYNDTHGHPAGDHVLRTVAKALRASLRAIDTVARYGGEEFAVLLPETDLKNAEGVAEKLRAAVAAEPIPGEAESQPGGRLTISLGLASHPQHSKDGLELVQRADEALYEAKRTGRNRYKVAGSEAGSSSEASP